MSGGLIVRSLFHAAEDLRSLDLHIAALRIRTAHQTLISTKRRPIRVLHKIQLERTLLHPRPAIATPIKSMARTIFRIRKNPIQPRTLEVAISPIFPILPLIPPLHMNKLKH